MRRGVIRGVALPLLLALVVTGCGGGDSATGPSAPSGPTAVTLVVPAGAFVEQSPATFSATVRVGGTVRPATSSEVAWSVEPADGGTITGAGVWTPARPGAATIVAAVTGTPSLRATRAVTVDSAAIMSLLVAPVSGVVPGDTIRPAVVGRDAVGRDRVVAVATVTSTNGVLRALGGGRFRADSVGVGALVATMGGQSAQLTGSGAIPVALGTPVGLGMSDQSVSVGAMMTLAASIQDRRGNRLPGTAPLTAQSRALATATVAVVADSLRVTAVALGATVVAVARGSVLDSFTVVVTPAAVTGLVVTPAAARIDWRAGSAMAVEGVLTNGGRTDLSGQVTIATLSGEVMEWVGGQLRPTRPPFVLGVGGARFDAGARTTVEFRYQAWRDTVDLPLHYRRPVRVEWALGSSLNGRDTLAMVVGEERDLNVILRDSTGAILSRSAVFGEVRAPVALTPGMLITLPGERIRAVFPTPTFGFAGLNVTYRETTNMSLDAEVTITGPAPVEAPMNFLGTGYVRVASVDTLSTVVRTAVLAAIARVEPIVAATPLNPVPINLSPGGCGVGTPSTQRSVGGVEARLEIRPLFDGVNGVLGSATSCVARAGFGMPVLGATMIDGADLPQLLAGGNLVDVLTHELLHIMGIGNGGPLLWPILNASSSDPRYPGAWGVSAYQALGGLDATIPLANAVGEVPGAHWRESVFGRELMTGFMNLGMVNPLSPITVGALRDMGYVVNPSAAEPYAISASVVAPGSAGVRGPQIDWAKAEHVRGAWLEVDASGRMRQIGPRPAN